MSTIPAPLDLLTPAPEGWQWVVLHARPRCEKKVLALAALKAADLYLPCTPRVHNYGNRERRYEVPLFTGYVFGRMPREHLSWYRGNAQVAHVIEVVDEARLLTPLRAVAEALASGLQLDVLPPLGPGSRVRVTGGPMKGLEAEVHERSGNDKVVIQLEMIQKAVAVEMDVQYLKRID